MLKHVMVFPLVGLIKCKPYASIGYGLYKPKSLNYQEFFLPSGPSAFCGMGQKCALGEEEGKLRLVEWLRFGYIVPVWIVIRQLFEVKMLFDPGNNFRAQA
jgi:hypothetical protein